MNKKIVNIVFYQFFGTEDTTKRACIFYEDGTVERVGFEQGIDACEIIVKERNIKSKDAFREMINNDLVHVVSGAEFEKNYAKYLPNTDRDILANVATRDIPTNDIDTNNVTDEDLDEIDAPTNTDKDEQTKNNNVVVPIVAPIDLDGDDNADDTDDADADEDEDEEELDEENESSNTADDAEDIVDPEGKELDEEIEEPKKKGFFARAWDKIKNNKIVKRLIIGATALAIGLGLYSCHQRKTLEGEMANSNLTSISANNDDNDNENVAKKVETITVDGVELKKGSNDYYDNYTFDQLLAVTDSKVQKRTMKNLDKALDKFNGEFADAHMENGKVIRPALTFDEVMSLQVAYNDYSKEDLRAIFNGADIRANQLSRAYKDANLQLMGAHVIEDSEHPVDMSMLIESKEGQKFYKKYHEAFLAAKEATGQDQIDKVTAFYNMVRSDFTVDPEKRTTGISHAEVYDIEAYKLSVTPMIAASEIMFQNLSVDVTLSDLEVDFFNNLGFCNMADSAFQRVEIVTLESAGKEVDVVADDNCGGKVAVVEDEHCGDKHHHDCCCCCCCDCHDEKNDKHGCCGDKEEKEEKHGCHEEKFVCGEDDTNPLYEQYRSAIIKKYKDKGIYYIDDSHRELTNLARFQEIVNGHRDLRCGGWRHNTWVEEHSSTHTETSTRTETSTSYFTVETREEKEIPSEIKKQIDDEIAEENERARREAEEKAEKERQRMQREEDENARRIEEEVRRDAEDLQRDIDEANRKIEENNKDDNQNNNTPVNERDFGDHNVDFDDEHSDENGNLDSSVEHITTDPTGADQALPDPNETGAQFDKEAPTGGQGGDGQQSVVPPEEHPEHQEPVDEVIAPVVEYDEGTQVVEEHIDPVVEHDEPAEVVEEHIEPIVEHDEPAEVVDEHIEPVVEHDEPSHVEEEHVEPVVEHDDGGNDNGGNDNGGEDFWVEEDSSSAKESRITYEQLVDEYVEFLAADNFEADELAYQYIR